MPKAKTKTTKKPAAAPIAANHAADALRKVVPYKSDVEYITKGELIAWAETIALIAVEKAIAAQSE